MARNAKNAVENSVVMNNVANEVLDNEVLNGGVNEPEIDEVENDEKRKPVLKTRKQVIAELLAAGNPMRKNLRVRSVTVTEQPNYVMVSLTLDEPVEGYVANEETGVFERGETRTVFTSSFTLVNVMRDDDTLAWAATSLRESPQGFQVILAGAKVNIIEQEVAADEVFVDPFSAKGTPRVFGHDTIIHHVVGIKLCSTGMRLLDMYAMKLMGGGMF